MYLFLQYKVDIAMLLMRIVLGILFFFQGYDKIFGLGLKQTEEGVAEALQETKLPKSLVKTGVAISSFVELFGGLLLIIGLFTIPSLTILGLDLFIVVFAMSMKEPLWDMRFVWPRFVLLITLLLLPATSDRFSFDHYLKFHESSSLISNY